LNGNEISTFWSITRSGVARLVLMVLYYFPLDAPLHQKNNQHWYRFIHTHGTEFYGNYSDFGASDPDFGFFALWRKVIIACVQNQMAMRTI
jgi:hypothetical protein